jgi:hypothetical protein
MQSTTDRQAELLMAVAGILRNRLNPNEPAVKTLTDAIDNVAIELAALGIVPPPLLRRQGKPHHRRSCAG